MFGCLCIIMHATIKGLHIKACFIRILQENFPSCPLDRYNMLKMSFDFATNRSHVALFESRTPISCNAVLMAHLSGVRFHPCLLAQPYTNTFQPVFTLLSLFTFNGFTDAGQISLKHWFLAMERRSLKLKNRALQRRHGPAASSWQQHQGTVQKNLHIFCTLSIKLFTPIYPRLHFRRTTLDMMTGVGYLLYLKPQCKLQQVQESCFDRLPTLRKAPPCFPSGDVSVQDE